MVHEKIKRSEPMADVKNAAIEWGLQKVELVKQIEKSDTRQARHQRYNARYNDELDTTEFISGKFQGSDIEEELTLIKQKRVLMAQKEATMEQNDEHDARQILNR
jgi:hypothetical protein